MIDTIAHRGPDGEGIYLDNCLGLGHKRLAIIDLSNAGHQPMVTSDKRYVITYNGEIYNFKELRKDLEKEGVVFNSKCDTEVVLNAFAIWGSKSLEKFNGMFAFAVWDTQEKRLFLARDRYGIKPLYYYLDGNRLIFSSEVKAIRSSGLYKATVDKEGLLEYLTFQNFFTNKTIYKDIKVLMPGTYLVVNESGDDYIERYFDFDFSNKLDITKEEAVEEIDRLLSRAVERQLVSDVPVNAYLSGGIDSGAITMIATKFNSHMRNFTIGFDLSSASGLELYFDERKKAEHISYLAKTEHYEMVLKAGDMERCMSNYTWHLEEPRVGQSYPNYYASKLASKFGKVVLSGVGGDEIFGGYPWRYFYTDSKISFDNFIENYYIKWQRLISNSMLKELLSPIWSDISDLRTIDIFRDIFVDVRKDNLEYDDCINLSLYLEAKTFLHGVLTVEDKLSMAHGLETRVPFLDNDLVDFALKLPNKLRVTPNLPKANENDFLSKVNAGRQGKLALRECLSKYLDQQIVNDRKQGFSSPDASWFRGDSIEYIKRELLNCPGYFNQKTVNSILDEHMSGNKNNRLAIWSILNLKYIIQDIDGHVV